MTTNSDLLKTTIVQQVAKELNIPYIERHMPTQSIDRFDHLITNRLIEVRAIHSLVMSDPDNYCKSSKLGIIQGDLDFLNMLLVDIRGVLDEK